MQTLNHTEQGHGRVEVQDERYRLSVPAVDASAYHNAQITSYATRHEIAYRAPLRLTLSARAEGAWHGTAGFGFWNHPFAPGERRVGLPKALWFFFASPPSDMALAKGIAGRGFKAATFNAARWPFVALLPAAPIGFLLLRQRWLYDHLWPIGQRAIGVDECSLDPQLLQTSRVYSLEWDKARARFTIDNQTVFETSRVPHGKLGFIAWIDNQYAIVTPQGHFGWGLVDVPQTQALVIDQIHIEQF